jgi:LAS superfamily LD-carboxypeptidase LdcB
VSIRRPRRARLLLVGALLAAAPVVAPAVSSASPGQEAPTASGGISTQVEVDDVLRASSTDVSGSLSEISADVAGQVAAVEAARAASAAADAELRAADEAVAATEARIAELTVQSDEVVVESFINPPTESALEALAAETPAESTVRTSLLDSEANANADVLSELGAAQDELEADKARQDEAAAAAGEQAEEAEAAVEDLVSVQSSETLFVLTVQDRLAANLAEAASLEKLDPAAAAALRAREGELADLLSGVISAREQRAQAELLQQAMAEAAERAAAEAAARAEAEAAQADATIGAASGNLSTVSCPAGGSITVDSSMAGNLASMLDAAAADGLNLCGNGYRDPEEQIALRRAHCGTSYYAIYEAPSSSCSPPTAPPGTSNHEQGLAVDFTCNGGGALSSSSPCFDWLEANASSYGFYNLPSEPWHWSNDGT